MSEIAADAPFSWRLASLKQRPLRYVGVCLAIVIRYFIGLFFLAAGFNKVVKGWMWSDYLKNVFEARIADLMALANPSAIESFGLMYLQNFALPLYQPIAYVVALGELYVGIACLLGLTSRWAGVAAAFFMVNFAIGGYYDASLIPLIALALVIAATPSGHWLGMDRKMQAKRPGSIWFC